MFNDKVNKMISNLRRDNSSGATELINSALQILKTQLDCMPDKNKNITVEIRELIKEIINSRPSS